MVHASNTGVTVHSGMMGVTDHSEDIGNTSRARFGPLIGGRLLLPGKDLAEIDLAAFERRPHWVTTAVQSWKGSGRP